MDHKLADSCLLTYHIHDCQMGAKKNLMAKGSVASWLGESKRTRASLIQPGYIFLEQEIIPLDSPLKRYDCTSQKGIKHIEHII